MEILTGNIMLIITALILIITIIVGACRGFIKTFFSAFSIIIALFVAVQAGPYVGKVVQRTPVYTEITSKIQENMNMQTDTVTDKVSDQIDAITEYPIPEFIRKALIENNNTQIYEALGVYDFNGYVASYMACLVINALSFLIVFIVAFGILKIIEGTLNLISKLPVLHSINKAGGIICGIVHGFILIWMLGVVLTVISWTGIGQWASQEINANPLLRVIYDHNLIVSTLTNMSKMLF